MEKGGGCTTPPFGTEKLRSSDFGKKLENFSDPRERKVKKQFRFRKKVGTNFLTLGNETLKSSVFGKRWWMHEATRQEGKVKKEFIFSTSKIYYHHIPPREVKLKKEFRFRKKVGKIF